jgi:hypothetical protein
MTQTAGMGKCTGERIRREDKGLIKGKEKRCSPTPLTSHALFIVIYRLNVKARFCMSTPEGVWRG